MSVDIIGIRLQGQPRTIAKHIRTRDAGIWRRQRWMRKQRKKEEQRQARALVIEFGNARVHGGQI